MLGLIQRALYPLPTAPRFTLPTPEDYVDLLDDGRDFAPAAVLIGIVEREPGNPVIVLTRRTDLLSKHPGQVALPGGRVDVSDVDEVAAALREAQEEIGLHPSHVRPLGFIDPIRTFTGFRVVPVVALIDAAHESRPCADEVAEVFEVPLSYVLDPRSVRRVEADFQGRVRHYWQYDFAGQRIWGATASMLVNLRDRIAALRG